MPFPTSASAFTSWLREDGNTGLNRSKMIEQIRPEAPAVRPRVALFDFDGTLSLIRSGWVDVMVPMMVEILFDLKTGESEGELYSIVEDFVWRLTGKETIYQMM